MAGRLPYRAELDGIRGVAIAIVVVSHGLDVTLGWPGVTLFFVLSGYLITSLLLSEHRASNRVDLRAFWVRRARRLLPALFVMLAVLVAIGGVAHGDALATLAYVANWVRAAGDPMWTLGHAWSLSIEEQFYLAWPLLAGLLVARRAPLVLAVGIVAVVVWRLALPYDEGMFRTDARADGLLAGALLAVLADRGWRFPRRGATVAVAGLLILGIVMPADLTLTRFGLAAGVGLSVAVVATARPGWLSWRPLVGLGAISYPLYLWHYPVFGLSGVRAAGIGEFLALTAVSIALAVASTYLVERRFRSPDRPRSSAAGETPVSGWAQRLRRASGSTASADAFRPAASGSSPSSRPRPSRLSSPVARGWVATAPSGIASRRIRR